MTRQIEKKSFWLALMAFPFGHYLLLLAMVLIPLGWKNAGTGGELKPVWVVPLLLAVPAFIAVIGYAAAVNRYWEQVLSVSPSSLLSVALIGILFTMGFEYLWYFHNPFDSEGNSNMNWLTVLGFMFVPAGTAFIFFSLALRKIAGKSQALAFQ